MKHEGLESFKADLIVTDELERIRLTFDAIEDLVSSLPSINNRPPLLILSRTMRLTKHFLSDFPHLLEEINESKSMNVRLEEEIYKQKELLANYHKSLENEITAQEKLSQKKKEFELTNITLEEKKNALESAKNKLKDINFEVEKLKNKQILLSKDVSSLLNGSDKDTKKQIDKSTNSVIDLALMLTEEFQRIQPLLEKVAKELRLHLHDDAEIVAAMEKLPRYDENETSALNARIKSISSDLDEFEVEIRSIVGE